MTRIEKLMKADRPWIADAGPETVMIFLEGIDLPNFASFVLLDSKTGTEALARYRIETALTGQEAEDLHSVQIAALAEAGVDLVSAVTMTYPDEAIGIARAARRHGLPHVLSFTLETDGCLPDGQTLQSAIAKVDAATKGSALFYMVNCAHPTHFRHVLKGDWVNRIGGIRANASPLSHAELDVMTELDDGDPLEFGTQYRDLGQLLPNLRLIGGCCGSDHRHVGAAAAHLHHPHAA